jgi:hypothetical protein
MWPYVIWQLFTISEECPASIRSQDKVVWYSETSVRWRQMLIYCNMDGQSIDRQQLSKHVKMHATIEVWVFISHCWATSSVPMNSLARNHMTCFLCSQCHDRSYAVIRKHVPIEQNFPCESHRGYITRLWQYSGVEFQMKSVFQMRRVEW